MSILVRMAQVWGAKALLNISGAHIDSTIYIGAAGLEFAERLAGMGAKVAVPTTLNVSGLDEHHWQEWDVPAEWAEQAQRQMVAYRSMGVQPTWTCAPYQTQWKPAFGQQVAWGESNAIVFANSVLGARTDRYGDFLDICAAVTGRVPLAGLHTDGARRATLVVDLRSVPRGLLVDPSWYAVVGLVVGQLAGSAVPALLGLPGDTGEDQLKALGATAASAGASACSTPSA